MNNLGFYFSPLKKYSKILTFFIVKNYDKNYNCITMKKVITHQIKKFILCLIIIFFTIILLVCPKTKYDLIAFQENYITKAPANMKYSVIFIYNNKCPDCQKIEKDVYKTIKMQSNNRIDYHFLNTKNNSTKIYAKRNKVSQTPTILLKTKSDELLYQYSGTNLKIIKKILTAHIKYDNTKSLIQNDFDYKKYYVAKRTIHTKGFDF